jgi:U3 small nucleolar RNA-associated protein 23
MQHMPKIVSWHAVIFIDLSIHLQVPGVPVIFALRNSLFLEPPSSFQRQFVKTSEEKRLHMTELECKMLRKRARTRSTDEEANGSSSEKEDVVDQNIGMQDLAKPQTARKGMDVKDKVQFKRKRAKVVLCTHIFFIPFF